MTRLKRFHSFGMGESRADDMLADVAAFENGGDVKLGFQARSPQLETKLAVHGESEADPLARLAPVEAECASGSATSSSPRTTRRSKA